MNVQLRRLFTVGLVSGSLALSALAGTAAVGAADGDNTADHIAVTVPAVTTRAVTGLPTDQPTQPAIVSPTNPLSDGRDDPQ